MPKKKLKPQQPDHQQDSEPPPPPLTPEELRAQLKRQLGFLERRCMLYDAGHHEEAIQIATIIRTIVHQTHKSTSLLTLMRGTTIKVLSTVPTYPSEQTISFVGMGMKFLGANGSGSRYFAQLGDGPPGEFVPLSKWWTHVVMVIDRIRIDRKTIVLYAANKDGGTHVDALPRQYKALAAKGAVGSFVTWINGEEIVDPIVDAHLVSLRQMAYELLNSPELLALTQPPTQP